MCVFCKIIAGEIPSKKIVDEKDYIIINDINPQAKVHLLAIPKEHYKDVTELDESRSAILGKMIMHLGKLATQMGLEDGFRIATNTGKFGCQSVEHLHVHLIGGEQLSGKLG